MTIKERPPADAAEYWTSIGVPATPDAEHPVARLKRKLREAQEGVAAKEAAGERNTTKAKPRKARPAD